MEIFVKENTWLPMCDIGWGNGYVIIPKDHKLYGKDYDDIDVNVHGGLTFSSDLTELDRTKWEEIPETITDGWVVGFDTAHFGDNKANWNRDKVLVETDNLRNQLLVYNSDKQNEED